MAAETVRGPEDSIPPPKKRERVSWSKREAKKKKIFGVIFLIVTVGGFGVIYYFIKFYEKPPAKLAVFLPEREGLEFFEWEAKAIQTVERTYKGGRAYKDRWTVTVWGKIRNVTGAPVEMPELTAEFLNRKGGVVFEKKIVGKGTLEPGKECSGGVSGKVEGWSSRPVKVRIQAFPK
ncbi:MAG: hypothetical protein ACYTHM_21050 [Planctomycetota bacterium]|jgi:hypothetical protein